MSELVDRFIHKYSRLPTERDPDYLEMLQMSKYRILDVPDVAPGKCANCGASRNDGRGYIDIGRHVDWYGAFILCGLCLKDISNEMGLFRPLEVSLLKSELEVTKLQELKEQGNNLQEQILRSVEEVKEYFTSLRSLESSSDLIMPYGVGISEESSESTTESDKPGVDTPKPRATKSTSSTRPKNLPSLAELLESSS